MEKTLNKESHIFLAVIPHNLAIKLSRKLILIISFLKKINPNIDKELGYINHAYDGDEYVGIAFISYLFLGGFLGFFIFYLFISQARELNEALGMGLLIFFMITFLFTYLAVVGPRNKLLAQAQDLDRTLNYALKEMILSAKSGGTLYEAMVSVSNADYGEVAKDFDLVVRKVNMGVPMKDALNELVLKTKSPYMRKAVWRLHNSLETGSDLQVALDPIVQELENYQKMQIDNYAKELNLWSLVYMMFSVAIPTIGSTIMVIVSAFSENGAQPSTFVVFGGICVLIQMGLSYLVKKRRPNVQF